MSTLSPRVREPAAVPTHRFKVGDTVAMKSWTGLSIKGAATYEITATLPGRDGSPQYRIRNAEERHERVTTEDNLQMPEA